jgi:hypothetical protein
MQKQKQQDQSQSQQRQASKAISYSTLFKVCEARIPAEGTTRNSTLPSHNLIHN